MSGLAGGRELRERAREGEREKERERGEVVREKECRECTE